MDSATKALDIKTVADRLSLKPATVRKMIFQRRIPTIKIGRCVRVREDVLTRILKEGLK